MLKRIKTSAKRSGRSRKLSSLVGFGAKPQSFLVKKLNRTAFALRLLGRVGYPEKSSGNGAFFLAKNGKSVEKMTEGNRN